MKVDKEYCVWTIEFQSYGYYESNCNFIVTYEHIIIVKEFTYCPNCGKKIKINRK